jgi:aspartyl-tRNA(Asn)/glutamyl-tRNA(Gln) amidotransferase subunit B
MKYEPVIGIEAHIELQTRAKMFCACAVVDSVSAPPNSAVCPVCAGMPGTLPVINRRAVEFAIRVALALNCQITPVSIFARKNYFYPDLPKGYQISQYEHPLAVDGRIEIGGQIIRIRRVHLEEDTGKLTHFTPPDFPAYSLVDLNRAGVPLLEIVTEPDIFSATQARVYAEALRALVRELGVNSGEMEKGVLRVEPNISVRAAGTQTLGTKVEIKNLNSFRALERGIDYEVARQVAVLQAGGAVQQETVGWDEAKQQTYSQRSKEDAHDYRYFPEPDLPPLTLDSAWVQEIRASLPELPWERQARLRRVYSLSEAESLALGAEASLSAYFESVTEAGAGAKDAANWILGEVFARLNELGLGVENIPISPNALAELIGLVQAGKINLQSAKNVLREMFASGQGAAQIVAARGFEQVSDEAWLAQLVDETLAAYSAEVASYRAGKVSVANWLFGQVMAKAAGKANPQVVRAVLTRILG